MKILLALLGVAILGPVCTVAVLRNLPRPGDTTEAEVGRSETSRMFDS